MFSVGARAGPAPRPGRGWQWPLRPGPSVVRPFAVGPYRWSAGHRGVDLTPAGRAPSAPTTGPTTGGPTVVAAAAGVVRFAGVVAGRPVVSVDHGSGVVTTYEPVRPTVVAGAPVRAGQAIGALAPDGSHCAPAWCLHWGAIVHGSYVDPLTLLRPRDPPILLPLP
jgi:murein DD-endopeptidase MepM/ murein hydrolase activator NlpD